VKYARWRARSGEIFVGILDGEAVMPFRPSLREPSEIDPIVSLAVAGPNRPLGPSQSVREVTLLPPIPDRPVIRDFSTFEQHARATMPLSRGGFSDDWYRIPAFYFQNPHVVLGPDDVVICPRSTKLDFELEVAAVVGHDCHDVTPSEAPDAIIGFTIYNDWSARDLQAMEMPLTFGPSKGKDFANSFGPVLATPDELGGVRGRPRAQMLARINGEEWSRGELGDMHFSFAELVAYASRDSHVRAGDVLGSGAVGSGCILELSARQGSDRVRWLQSGDVVELEVEGIGVLRNTIAISINPA
jgi:fumarylacetoacetate (FAA) hydrolase